MTAVCSVGLDMIAIPGDTPAEVISGIICGKPMDELYFEEYKKILVEEVADPTLPIVANVNIGHATPRCIIPFGVDAVVDANRQQITFFYEDK